MGTAAVARTSVHLIVSFLEETTLCYFQIARRTSIKAS